MMHIREASQTIHLVVRIILQIILQGVPQGNLLYIEDYLLKIWWLITILWIWIWWSANASVSVRWHKYKVIKPLLLPRIHLNLHSTLYSAPKHTPELNMYSGLNKAPMNTSESVIRIIRCFQEYIWICIQDYMLLSWIHLYYSGLYSALQGGRSWRARGDRQISLCASADRPLQIFTTKNTVF